MLRYRLLYSLTLVAVFAFYLAYSPWFSWYLLVLVLLLIPLDFLISLPGMLTRSVRLTAPHVLRQNASGALVVTAVLSDENIDNPKRRLFPVRCLYTRLDVSENGYHMHCDILCPAVAPYRSEVAVNTAQTGLTVFKIKRLRAVSLLGLFSKKIAYTDKVSVLVLPSPKKPANSVTLPRSLMMKPKPGGGFSEEHEIRGYLPGDPVRSIHWKLSAKFDSLIIREPLIPPQLNRLVHIMPWEDATQRDNALGHLLWISEYLIDKNLTFHIRYCDRQLIAEISSEHDLTAFLRRVLDDEETVDTVHIPRITRFSWVYKVHG